MIWRSHIHKVVLRLPDSLIELEFGNVGFSGEGKTGVPGKTSRSKGENQQQTQATYGVDAGI